MPSWWLLASGIYFILASLFMLTALVLCLFLVRAVGNLTSEVKRLSERVDTVLVNVRDVTQSVGGRAKSIATTVDTVSSNIGRNVEIASSLVLGFMTLMRLMKMFKARTKGK